MIELHKVPLSAAPEASRNPLDLTVPDGGQVVLLGPAGCGKETLLRLLAGLEAPRGGLIRASFNGLDLTLPQLGRYSSLLVRGDPLAAQLTVRENLLLQCLLKGNGKDQARLMCDQAIRFYGLEKCEDMRAASLPYDWKRYAALAAVLMQRAGLLLLDEPLLRLAPQHRLWALEMIRMGAGGRTMITAAADPADAQVLGGRLLIIRNGCLIFDGTCAQALERTGTGDLRGAYARLYGEVLS